MKGCSSQCVGSDRGPETTGDGAHHFRWNGVADLSCDLAGVSMEDIGIRERLKPRSFAKGDCPVLFRVGITTPGNVRTPRGKGRSDVVPSHTPVGVRERGSLFRPLVTSQLQLNRQGLTSATITRDMLQTLNIERRVSPSEVKRIQPRLRPAHRWHGQFGNCPVHGFPTTLHDVRSDGERNTFGRNQDHPGTTLGYSQICGIHTHGLGYGVAGFSQPTPEAPENTGRGQTRDVFQKDQGGLESLDELLGLTHQIPTRILVALVSVLAAERLAGSAHHKQIQPLRNDVSELVRVHLPNILLPQPDFRVVVAIGAASSSVKVNGPYDLESCFL